MTYITADLFDRFTCKEFKDEWVKWDLFGIDGSVYPEIGKIRETFLHYNEETYKEITGVIKSLNIPQHYASIQIRGGDKLDECYRCLNASE